MLYKYDVLTILIMMNVFDNLNNTFNALINFFTWCEEYQDKLSIYIKSYDDLNKTNNYKNCTECTKPISNKKEYNYNVIIVNEEMLQINNDNLYQISNDKQFCIQHNDNKINLNFGEIMVIRGESGIGKSTLINKLLGKIKDDFVNISVTNNLLTVENNNDCFFEFYQSIKEKMPSGNITIKDLFNCEILDKKYNFSCCLCLNNKTNIENTSVYNECKKHSLDYENKLIVECLKICELENWYENIMDKNLHVNISNKISGGEKSRLALATIIYKLVKTGNTEQRLLILDEPEQGLDREIAEKVLQNIFYLCRHKKENVDDKTLNDLLLFCEQIQALCKLKTSDTITYFNSIDNELLKKLKQIETFKSNEIKLNDSFQSQEILKIRNETLELQHKIKIIKSCQILTKDTTFNNLTSIIMVTHLCDCTLNKLCVDKKYRIIKNN
jgi:ABC-type glutathione transport system ATPase component